MNAVNRAATALFDLLLWPLESLGAEFVIVLLSGLFGVIALLAFKALSRQASIKRTKDRIKGHMIAIRIWQDDLRVVALSVGRILVLNLKYLALNFGPILPMIAPFTLIAAQLVVRYGFDPVPLEARGQRLLAGQGLLLEVELERARAAEVAGLEVRLPRGLRAVSPLVRIPGEGRAALELVAERAGEYEIELALAGTGGELQTKRLVAGRPARLLQPERVGDFWSAWLWPAEDAFGSGSAFRRIAFSYPDRALDWMPDGPGGVLLAFVVAAMAAGLAAMKPLGVEI